MFLDIRSAGDLVLTCIEMVNNVLFQKNFSAISSYDIGTVRLQYIANKEQFFLAE